MKIVNSYSELIEALGIDAGDELQIMTPQFNRSYDIEINFIPHDEGEIKALMETAPKDILVKMGVCVFYTDEQDDEPTYLNRGEIHYLFPGEWYDYIPNGLEVVGIFGERYKFIHGQSDNDIRFGCLPYGFVRGF